MEHQAGRKSARAASVDDEVAEAVIEGLGHFGSETVVETIIYLLELEHSISIRNVAGNPAALRTALSEMFGPASSSVEARICRALAKRLGVDVEGKSLETLISNIHTMRVRA